MDAREKAKGQPVVFSMPNEECIWSKAGIIESTKCANAFDCMGCSLEKDVRDALKHKSEAGREDGSKVRIALPLMPKGQCRHVLSGRISYGKCSYQDCATCPIEQTIDDYSHLPGPRRSELSKASGFDVARNYYYHTGHTWARVEYGGWVRIGVDDFALRLIGPQDSIELPALGAMLRQGAPAATLKRGPNEAPIISPVDGVVAAVNHKLAHRAASANEEPYEDGWLMLIRPTNLRENLANLYFDAEGHSWIEDESMYLNSLLCEGSRVSLVTPSSETVRDVVEQAPEIGWDRLVEEFL